MQEPEALLPYNPSFGFLAANRPCCQLFLPDRAFPSFPFKCKLHTGQIRWYIHFFLPFLCPVFQFNSLVLGERSGPQIIALPDCSAGIVKIIVWLTVMKMNPTALKQNPSTFLGSWVLISATLCLKDTEFLRDAEADHDHSWKQCVCAYSPELQVELSCRATGRDNIAMSAGIVAFLWGKCYFYWVWSIQRIIS